jgi:hypothetical protein
MRDRQTGAINFQQLWDWIGATVISSLLNLSSLKDPHISWLDANVTTGKSTGDPMKQSCTMCGWRDWLWLCDDNKRGCDIHLMWEEDFDSKKSPKISKLESQSEWVPEWFTPVWRKRMKWHA